MTKAKLPAWVIPAWRGLRTAMATAFVQTMAQPMDWTKPDEAFRMIAISVASGTLVVLGKAIRDKYAVEIPALTKLPF